MEQLIEGSGPASSIQKFSWVSFYTSFANVLLKFKHKRKDLLDKLQKVFAAIGMRFPTMERDRIPVDVDPFTVFSFFNKKINNENRKRIIAGLISEFDVKAIVPTDFDGIPVLDPRQSCFFRFQDLRKPDDIDNLWEVFEQAIRFAYSNEKADGKSFSAAYDVVLKQDGIRWNITMALFWIRPTFFINLDSRNRWFISQSNEIPGNLKNETPGEKASSVPSGSYYLKICDDFRTFVSSGGSPFSSLMALSDIAFSAADAENKRLKKLKSMPDTERSKEMAGVASDAISSGNDDGSVFQEYTKNDFLAEVFLSSEEYEELATLINTKLDVILQGPPGVGKTFAAKRLAYSLIGRKDDSKIFVTQFHQSVSYEDFVIGYKPNSDGGFVLNKVPICTRGNDKSALIVVFLV